MYFPSHTTIFKIFYISLLKNKISGFNSLIKSLLTLLISGADVDLKTETNATPLLYAAICGNMTVASILVSAGADVNQYDMEGNSPIIHAAKYVLCLQRNYLTRGVERSNICEVIFRPQTCVSAAIQTKNSSAMSKSRRCFMSAASTFLDLYNNGF